MYWTNMRKHLLIVQPGSLYLVEGHQKIIRSAFKNYSNKYF